MPINRKRMAEVLELVRERSPITPLNLAKNYGIHVKTMRHVLDCLEAAGAVTFKAEVTTTDAQKRAGYVGHSLFYSVRKEGDEQTPQEVEAQDPG